MQDLSAGAVHGIYTGVTAEEDPIVEEPVVQVLSVKKVVSAGPSGDRYRLILSDGNYYCQSMLATQLNGQIVAPDTAIEKNTVIRVTSYACNTVQNRRIIICLGYEVLYHTEEKIGQPGSIDTLGAADNAGGQPAEAPAPAVRAPAPAPKKAAAPKSNNGAPIYPIESLSPYQNKWTIKARVSAKSDIRHWSNAKGEGKLFSVNLLDESGEIKATGFGDQCDSLYPILEEGKVFLISKARVNIAKKQFSNLSNEYEITFERNTEVQPCDDVDDVPQVKYNFVPLGNLVEHEKDATCDVLGIVQDNGETVEITSKATSKQIKKRDLTICDESGYSCRVTLWGRMAETWVDSDNGVYAFKGARVGDFGGRTLSMGGQSTMAADPDIPEAHRLRGWYDTEGRNQTFVPQSSGGGGAAGAGSFKKDDFKTLDRVEIEQLGFGDKPSFFSSRATIEMIKQETMSYPACPSEKCNKKVTLESEDEWRCEKCDKSYPAPEHRYIMSMCVADHTTQQWISAFNEAGQEIIGVSANELNRIKEDDEAAFAAIVNKAQGKMYNLSLRAKAETYGDNTRVKVIVQRLAPVQWAAAGHELLADIEKYN